MSTEERVVLERIACSETLPAREVIEARGLVMAASGESTGGIARLLGVSRHQPRPSRTPRPPRLRVIYSGRRRLIPITELHRWVERQAVAPPALSRRA